MGFSRFKGFGPVPVPGVVNYLPTWHNRHVGSNHGTWSTARGGYNLKTGEKYQRPDSYLTVDTHLVAMYWIIRSWLNFNTQGVGSISAARLGLYITDLIGTAGGLVVTKGLSLEPIDEDDWATQTNEVTILGQIAQSDLVLNQYNWTPLNAAGIAWINQSALELKQHESYDWARDAYLRFYANIWISQSRTPQSNQHIRYLRLRMRRRGSPGTLYITVKAADANHCPTGPPLASGTINANTFTTAAWGAWYLIDLGAGFDAIAGTEYCTECHKVGGDTNNAVEWISSNHLAYPSGYASWSTDGGSTWGVQTAWDAYFIDYEEAQVGGTNFCLRAAKDVSDTPPTIYEGQVTSFNSAQKGEGYLPLLEVTS